MLKFCRKKKGFTLIELLIVMAIIAILVGMGMPGLLRARERARRTKCMNNLKEINLAIQEYMTDYNERYPDTLTDLVNAGYLGTANLDCPTAPGTDDYVYTKPAGFPTASTEICSDKPGNHEGGRNALYGDGHVSWVPSP